MNRFLPLVLALLCALAYGTTTRYGKIVDPQGQGIAGAVITDGRSQAFSAQDGSFYYFTASDSISVSRLGFQTRRVAFAALKVPIVLQPEPIMLPTVKVSESAGDFLSAPPDRIALPIDPDRHYYSAGEILSSTPAIQSNDVLLKGERQSVSILGNLARHSLIVLDGVPLNPDGESFDLSLLDVENIASIELIKNNASVYGGGSAIGGVVRITSKQGLRRSGRQVFLGTELGSFGYARNTLSFSAARPDWSLRLSLGNQRTRNDFHYQVPDWWAADSVATRENNAKRQNSLSASFALRSKSARLILQTDYTDFRRELPGTVNFLELYRNAYLSGYASRSHISLDAPLWNCESQTLAWFNLDRTLYNNTTAPLAVYVSKYRQKLSDLGLRSSISREFPLAAGLSANAGIAAEAGLRRYQNLNLLQPDADLDHHSRFANASAKSGLSLDRGSFTWIASGALRYDWQGDEDKLSWRLESSVKHEAMVESTLGGTWGTAFSLPSPYDLYWKGDSQALGNPNLASETSRGWQAWLANAYGPWSLKTAYHHNEIENLIQWRQIQMFGSVWKPVNIGKARIRNLEVEAGVQALDWLRFSASLLLTRAQDLSLPTESGFAELMYTPRQSYALQMDVSRGILRFWSKYRYTGRQFSTPDNLADALPAYALLDAGLSAAINVQDWKLTPQISVHNLLNRRYEVYAYVPQPGISFYGGLSLQLAD